MHVRIARSLAGCLATVALIVSVAAHANLVVNGGFETGDFTGWTQFGNTGFSGVDGSDPASGAFAAFFGPTPTAGGIFQNIVTTPGKFYAVDFWLQAEADPFGVSTPNSFAFLWGGTPELVLGNTSAFGYTHFSFTLQATGPSTELRFIFENDPAFWDFDAVSVVPEPGTLALVALAGLAAFARRRRSA